MCAEIDGRECAYAHIYIYMTMRVCIFAAVCCVCISVLLLLCCRDSSKYSTFHLGFFSGAQIIRSRNCAYALVVCTVIATLIFVICDCVRVRVHVCFCLSALLVLLRRLFYATSTMLLASAFRF